MPQTVMIPSPADVQRAAAERRDSLVWSDYRALFRTFDGTDPVASVAEELQRWMAENRQFNAPTHKNARVEGGGKRFEIIYAESEEGREFKAVLTEESEQGVWTTTLVAEPAGWVSLAVTSSEGRFVAVPNLAKNLLSRLPLGDAKRLLLAKPQVWDEERVDELMELLLDPERTAAVFVAAMGDDESLAQTFETKAKQWFHQTYGLAHAFVVTPAARRELAERLGIHAVMPWSVRTYLPGLTLGDYLDGRRHRFLMVSTLTNRPERAVAQLLGGIARSQTHSRPLPPEIRLAEKAVARAANRQLTDSLRAASEARRARGAGTPSTPLTPSPVARPEPPATPAVPPEVSQPEHAPTRPADVTPSPSDLDVNLVLAQSQLALVRDYFGLKEISETALDALLTDLTAPALSEQESAQLTVLLDDLQAEVEQRDEQIEFMSALLEEQEIEVGAGDEEASRLRNEVQWLRAQLREAGKYEAAASHPAPTISPRDMSELVKPEKLPEGIVFTGDLKFVDDVVGCDDGRCVRVAWDAVLAMADYLRARREGVASGNFHHYVLHTPGEFRTFAPAKSAENETGITQQQFGSERLFPVPTDVDAKGRVMMNAHIKLGRIGLFSPRMHYFLHSESERIFIGYIGRHLTNTQTN